MKRHKTALAVSGPILDAAVRRLLQSLNYPRCNVVDALTWIEGRGTIVGCPVVEREDWPAVTALVARHTGDVESDPADWPAWTDADRWAPTEPGPSVEPSPEDRAWWATERARLDAGDA